jgi:hypothetical protein
VSARVGLVALVLAAMIAGRAGRADAAPCGTPVDDPPPATDGAVAALGKYLYWIGGTNGRPTTLARRFDVKTKRWETLPEPSGARIHASLVAAGGALYVVGGMSSSLRGYGDIQRFDPKTCRWSAVGSLRWKPQSPMATAVGARIVVAGGQVDNGASSLQSLDFWSIDDAASVDASGRATALPELALARTAGAAVTVGKDVWVIGGRVLHKDVDSLGSASDDVEILAAGARTWKAGPSLPFSAEVFAVALPDKTVIVFGRGVLESKKPAVLDRGKGEWREAKSRGDQLEFLEGAAVIDGVVYALGKEIVGGGLGGKDVYRVATYDPRGDRWTVVDEFSDEP